MTTAGTSMSPVPRMQLASPLNTHNTTAPAKTTLEYCSAASSAAPPPPIARYSAGPPSSPAAQNTPPSPALTATACSTSPSASARRPAPSARAMADDMPPPIAPDDIICMSISPGNTSAIPASAGVPSRPMKCASINPVEAWASMTSTFGPARRNSNPGTGACSSASVRALRGEGIAGVVDVACIYAYSVPMMRECRA